MEESFESSKGTILYEFINKEKSKTLLLIHGFMEDHEVWNELKEKLSANIIVIDVLGFGKSIPYSAFDFSMPQHAQSIHELLNFLQPSNLFVLGHSMGGYITLELSKLNPEINMALLHSTCLADSNEKKQNRNKTIEVLERDASVFIREFYWNLFAEHRKNEFAERIEILKQKAEKIPVENIIKTVIGLRDRADNTDVWKESSGDNIIIGGRFDKLMDVEELEGLSYLGESDWAELEDSGHMGFYEEPESLRDIIRYWLEI